MDFSFLRNGNDETSEQALTQMKSETNAREHLEIQWYTNQA